MQSPQLVQGTHLSPVPISRFAQSCGNPILTYLESLSSLPANKQLPSISFLSSDPSAYGNSNFKMTEEGYEIIRQSILNRQNHSYSESTGERAARTAVAKFFGHKNTTPEDVILTSGANMGLLYCLDAFCLEGDNILVPSLGYPFFEQPAQGNGVEVRHYALNPEEGFEINFSHLQTLIDRNTQFIFVVNPANPSGSVYSKKHLLELLKVAEKHKLPIVCDEVYYMQSFEDQGCNLSCTQESQDERHYFVSLGELTNDVPVITISGVEKILNVPGWCTSWLIITDPMGHMTVVRQNLGKMASIFLHPNVFTQRALPQILTRLGGASFAKSIMPQVKKQHDILLQRFAEFDCLRAFPAQGTCYMLVQVLPGRTVFESDVEFAHTLLKEYNISVLPLSVFGKGIEGFRMMTCGTPTFYDEFFNRLAHFLNRYKVVKAVLMD